MTPAQVRVARASHRYRSGDLYGTVGLSAVIDRETQMPRIADVCAEMAILPAHVPDFVAQCGYEWITDPESYDTAAEATLQRRGLLMLAKFWADQNGPSALAPRMSNLIVTQEFITQIGFSTPRLSLPREPSGHRILSLPNSFFEFPLWIFAGLRCWVSHQFGSPDTPDSDGSWSLVGTPVPTRAPKPLDHVTAKELIARTLAEAGRDVALDRENAALLIREEVSELSGQTGELDPGSLHHFEQNASYMVTEFAVAHELGHALSPTPPETEMGSKAAEELADRIGCMLLEITAPTRVFGWGEEQLAPLAQAAVGVALFRCMLIARNCLLDELLRRPTVTPGNASNEMMKRERVRARVAQKTCDALLAELATIGNAADANWIVALNGNADGFVRDLRETIIVLPDATIKQAIKVAQSTSIRRETKLAVIRSISNLLSRHAWTRMSAILKIEDKPLTIAIGRKDGGGLTT